MLSICLLPMLAAWLCLAPPGYAAHDTGTPIYISTARIRQEINRHNGVLTAGARALDEKIAFLFDAHGIRTLEEYSRWLEKNVTYQKSAGARQDITPEKTLEQRYGNCQNFSALNAAVLEIAGFEPLIIAGVNANEGHAIYVFQVDGYYYWFDNARLRKSSAQSLTDFAHELMGEYGFHSLLELDRNSNRWKLVYRRI